MGRTLTIQRALCIACLAMVAFAGRTCVAEEINWRTSYAKALEEAAESDRPVLVKVSAQWCSHCTRMQRETLSDANVANEVSDNFVPLALDADRDAELIRRFQVRTFPTTIVVAPDRTILRRITGYQGRSEFTANLRGALQR